MSTEVATRRAFLEQANHLVQQLPNPLNIVATTNALEAAINTMTDEPMRLLLVTAAEAKVIEQNTGISV